MNECAKGRDGDVASGCGWGLGGHSSSQLPGDARRHLVCGLHFERQDFSIVVLKCQRATQSHVGFVDTQVHTHWIQWVWSRA